MVFPLPGGLLLDENKNKNLPPIQSFKRHLYSDAMDDSISSYELGSVVINGKHTQCLKHSNLSNRSLQVTH